MNPHDPAIIEQQWLQARAQLGDGNLAAAIPFLESAAEALHPAANFNLGCLHLFALIDSADRKQGTGYVSQAAELGHSGALYQMALLELGKSDATPDWPYANECLRKSAAKKHPPALRSLALHWSRAEDKSLLSLGNLCLEHAARGGDIVSLALLMHRLYDGIGCEKNLLRASAIHTLLMQSSLNLEPPATPANPQLAQVAGLSDLPELPPPQLQHDLWELDVDTINDSPWIGIAENVISLEESRLIQYIGGPHLNPSVTATPDGERTQVQLRTSFDMVFEEMLEDISLLLVQRRMTSVVGTTPAYSEYLQLLRYQNGQEYRPHRDYLPPSMITPVAEGGPGQRESTVIVYLNDVEHGGETEFLELNKKIAPKTGRVLAFKNLYSDGTPDPRTLHAGLPVSRGSKWIATLWVHQGIFRK